MPDRPLAPAQLRALRMLAGTSSQNLPVCYFDRMAALERRGLVLGTGRGNSRDHVLTAAGTAWLANVSAASELPLT